MICYVVNIGIRSDQFRTIVEIHANHKRSRFGRAIDGDARHEFSIDLECRHPFAALASTPGNASPISRTVSEIDCGRRSKACRGGNSCGYRGRGMIQSMLFGIQSTDMASYLIAVLPMVGAAFLASLLTARRASRVDPAITTRQ